MKTSDSTVKILAPAKKVWLALTDPGLVKQWQYGSDLQTTWEVGTSIIFRNEWNGQVFEQRGTVIEFSPESRLKYSLFFARPDLQDIRWSRTLYERSLSNSGRSGPDVSLLRDQGGSRAPWFGNRVAFSVFAVDCDRLSPLSALSSGRDRVHLRRPHRGRRSRRIDLGYRVVTAAHSVLACVPKHLRSDCRRN